MANIMDKFTQFLEEKLMPVAGKVANQRHLAAIKDGMVITLPFIIVGSVFLILGNLPIPALANFYKDNATGQVIARWLSYPVDVTFNLLGFIACIGIAYKLSQWREFTEILGIPHFNQFLLVLFHIKQHRFNEFFDSGNLLVRELIYHEDNLFSYALIHFTAASFTSSYT